MKLTLLAAAALIAAPALAQTSGSSGTSSPNSNGGQGTPTQTYNSGTGAQDAAPTSPSDTTSAPASQTTPAAPTGADPAGGYQPAPSPSSGPPPAGATVTFQPTQSPDQAYPAPAPLAKYPVCKAGQYDDCLQASDAHKGGHKKMARHKK
ncbi:hypothetical protein [Sphingomonas bacterium]|uniref:hypothetical protein n=1 Tax=Sphingomonas bacterium TaxID=1895847 RepID=UPI001575DD89|nr:hypothetical protein [Sphingomonas bacterium]